MQKDGLNGVQVALVECLDDALELKRWMGERRPVLGVDSETGGLRYWRGGDRLRTVQVGDAMTGWVIPAETWLGLAQELMNAYDRRMVLHNVAFDAHFFARYGMPLKRHLVDDTLVMHHIIDPPARHGLKPLSIELIDPAADAGQKALSDAMTRNEWTWDTVPVDLPSYWAYSALDPVLTARLDEEFGPHARDTDVYALEMSAVWANVDAEAAGIKIDAEYAEAEIVRLKERYHELMQRGKDEFGVKLTSSQDVTARLIEDGVPLWKQTASGRWSLDAEVIEALDGVHPLGTLVHDVKQAKKFEVAYFKACLDKMGDDHRVHPSINTLGARTGRMSISNPPLQQIPSKDWRVRRMFIPSEGNVLLSADLSNIELRLLAHYSQDATMMEAFLTGEDVHMRMARELFGPDAGPAERSRAKTISFAKVYGAGAKKIALQLGVPVEEAKKVLRMYDETFPGVPDFIRYVQDTGEYRFRTEGLAYVADPAGRKHTLTRQEAGWEKFYALTNYITQGWAASILKQSLAALHQSELGQYYRLPVHDELILDIPEELADAAAEEMKEIMAVGQAAVSVPLQSDIEINRRSWAEHVKGFPGYGQAA